MPGLKRFGVARMREFAQARVEQSSLRAVADDIGMSFSGLRSFLAGTAPHPDTVQKVVLWYGRVRNAAVPEPQKADRGERAEVDAAIQRLVQYVRSDARPNVQEKRVREVMRRFADEVDPERIGGNPA